jgi:EPS-associated MarR family transcriptional regulator
MEHELRHKIFSILQADPEINQRELARRLGISLGKTNYCLQALIEKGWVKARNFKNNRNKLAYSYLLTPSGLEEKARLTVRFLRHKMSEYQELKEVIAELQAEVDRLGIKEEGVSLPD